MSPEVGTTCKYTFATKFASLNGVYTLMGISSFESCLENGVDFTKSFYTPAGLTTADLNNDYLNYRKKNVFELQSVASSADIIYAPIATITGVPDPTVKKYSQVYAKFLIGPQNDTSVYTWVASEVSDILASVTGVVPQVVWEANPAFDEWLTASEYQALDAERQANIKQIATRTETIEAQANQIALLQAQIRALTAIIVANSNAATPATPAT